jgi:hypothetical protein
MNQKQFIAMWCGITAVVLASLMVIDSYGLACPFGFFVWVFTVALLTSGLIYTLKSEDSQETKNIIQDMRKDILRKRQFKMIKNDYNKNKHDIRSESRIS